MLLFIVPYMLVQRINTRVNTSHVIVHPLMMYPFIANYLLCQYIPCYCSSYMAATCQKEWRSVNTSHVIVHLRSYLVMGINWRCVNTSHVIVHLANRISGLASYIVSIHPMLLFIKIKGGNCYGIFVSIHPMLLFITIDLSNLNNVSGVNTSHVIVHQSLEKVK